MHELIQIYEQYGIFEMSCNSLDLNVFDKIVHCTQWIVKPVKLRKPISSTPASIPFAPVIGLESSSKSRGF